MSFSAETVTVVRDAAVLDDLGEVVSTERSSTEVDVLVQPGATADLDATRPQGVTAAYTLHFPKTWTEPLRGCTCIVRGEQLEVIGDPRPYAPENTPGRWNMTVEVTRTDG